MIIQHNIMAINSHRQLGINNSNLSKNLEKLSSGYRINRAADDAAGLAISEKMRAQITGLDRAVLNAQDGASLIQTAEGALSEVHSMLNRMVELATQSANGTIQADDRQKIESEVTALKDEIDRISKSTNFNGIQLLDGSLSATAPKDIIIKGAKVTETPAVAGRVQFEFGGVTALKSGDKLEYTLGVDDGNAYTMTFTVSTDLKSLVADDGTVYSFLTQPTTGATANNATAGDIGRALEGELSKTKLKDDYIIRGATGALTFTARIAGTEPPQIAGVSWRLNDNGPTNFTIGTTATRKPQDAVSTIVNSAFKVFDGTNEDTATFSVNGQNFVLVASSQYDALVEQLKDRDVNVVKIAADAVGSSDLANIAHIINQKTGMAFEVPGTLGIVVAAPRMGNGLTMQVGDTADDFNKITVSVDDMSSAGLGIKTISMATQESAARSLTRIKAAIEKVSVNRGNLGALQNRLEHTINNLNVTSENMTAAESRIRDVDMAKEMMAFTKNNVLSQAAQAMLSQANMQPQQVLQLLR